MSISFSNLVSVLPRTIGGGLTGQDFNMLMLSENENLPVGQVVTFYNTIAMSKLGGSEYNLATTYFNADVNKQKVPSAILLYRHVSSAVSAWLRGAEYTGTLQALKAITNGSITITIDGTLKEITGIDLSSATSLSSVADALGTALSATVTYNSSYNAFVIASATTGADSTITFPSVPASGTDISAVLGMYESDGAVISQGSAAMTLTSELNALVKKSQKFVTIMPAFQETEEQALEIANWVNSFGTRFLYLFNEESAVPTTGVDVACFMKTVADFYGISGQYDDKGTCAFAGGVIASIDWSRYNGRKTLAYKTSSSLSPVVTDEAVANNLLANGYNFYGSYGNASNDLNLFQNGQCSGSARWIDTYCGQIYIADALQNAWVNILSNINTLPYNEDGYSMLRTAAQDPIVAAINCGVIRKGVSLSEAQKTQVMSEAGLDISEELSTMGYYLQILDPTAEVRANRGTPIINLWYMDGGSVQKIVCSATTIL